MALNDSPAAARARLKRLRSTPSKEWISIAEAAERAGIELGTLWAQLKRYKFYPGFEIRPQKDMPERGGKSNINLVHSSIVEAIESRQKTNELIRSKFFTPAQAAGELGVTKQAVMETLNRGFPHLTIGRHRLVPRKLMSADGRLVEFPEALRQWRAQMKSLTERERLELLPQRRRSNSRVRRAVARETPGNQHPQVSPARLEPAEIIKQLETKLPAEKPEPTPVSSETPPTRSETSRFPAEHEIERGISLKKMAAVLGVSEQEIMENIERGLMSSARLKNSSMKVIPLEEAEEWAGHVLTGLPLPPLQSPYTEYFRPAEALRRAREAYSSEIEVIRNALHANVPGARVERDLQLVAMAVMKFPRIADQRRFLETIKKMPIRHARNFSVELIHKPNPAKRLSLLQKVEELTQTPGQVEGKISSLYDAELEK